MSPPVFGNDPEYQASDIYIDMSLSPLGEGSLGIVYRGALQGNYHVVIKVVRGSIADDFKLMKALFRELKNWEGLAHYNGGVSWSCRARAC